MSEKKVSADNFRAAPLTFEQLLDKVAQAEHAVEAQERRAAADWRQLKGSWRAAWTPGRIVIAGLASGFLVGRARPASAVSGGGVIRMLASLSTLLASTQAAAATGEAEHAAETAEDTAETAAATAGVPGAAAVPPVATPEAYEP